MTTPPTPDAAPAPRPDPAGWRGATGPILVLIALLMGVLRGAAIVAMGWGGLVIWVEAGYALLLHLGAGLIAAALVAALGRWPRPLERPAPAAREVAIEPPAAAPETPRSPEPARREDPAAWRARLLAAREAGDARRVLEIRDETPEGADEGELAELDADLGKWLLGLVHRRLRSGPLQGDLVELVERGSEAFGRTKEGASLRAALPTLRRGAGLCPRCARPYVGVWEACPECMGRPEPPPPAIPGLVAVDEAEYEPRSVDGRWFVDPDDEPPADR